MGGESKIWFCQTTMGEEREIVLLGWPPSGRAWGRIYQSISFPQKLQSSPDVREVLPCLRVSRVQEGATSKGNWDVLGLRWLHCGQADSSGLRAAPQCPLPSHVLLLQ